VVLLQAACLALPRVLAARHKFARGEPTWRILSHLICDGVERFHADRGRGGALQQHAGRRAASWCRERLSGRGHLSLEPTPTQGSLTNRPPARSGRQKRSPMPLPRRRTTQDRGASPETLVLAGRSLRLGVVEEVAHGGKDGAPAPLQSQVEYDLGVYLQDNAVTNPLQQDQARSNPI
jgi:hypothetical protein